MKNLPLYLAILIILYLAVTNFQGEGFPEIPKFAPGTSLHDAMQIHEDRSRPPRMQVIEGEQMTLYTDQEGRYERVFKIDVEKPCLAGKLRVNGNIAFYYSSWCKATVSWSFFGYFSTLVIHPP